jgi:hypothetical protein
LNHLYTETDTFHIDFEKYESDKGKSWGQYFP